MGALPDSARIAALLRDALQTDIREHDVQESLDPLKNFIDWLDEPDKVLDAAGQTVYFWSPVRLDSKPRPFEVAIVDLGDSRAVYLGARQ